MLEALRETWSDGLGLGLRAEQLGFVHMALRGVVVFCFAILLSRIADRRLLGRSAGYDIMVLVILGSVLSRAVNGQARFYPTLGAGAVLVLIHRFAGTLAFHSHFFSKALKGATHVLVRDGRVDEDALRRNKITPDDLDENLRNHGNVGSAGEVAEARLERNGVVSVVKAKPPPALARSDATEPRR
ncbi:MAG TPA: YetF domain-containing protein [Opitutaceae bacterium]|nr:YetF domain-containing protein [Opitutaceae bacterium]